jgi:hypothetical protein
MEKDPLLLQNQDDGMDVALDHFVIDANGLID